VTKQVALALLILIVIVFNGPIIQASTNNSNNLVGQTGTYIGISEISFKGSIGFNETSIYSTKEAYLTVKYRVTITITDINVYTGEIKYTMRITDYNISYNLIPVDKIEKINNSLTALSTRRYTHVDYNLTIDPPIVLDIDYKHWSIKFSRSVFPETITGIIIYDHVYCLEKRLYKEKFINNIVSRDEETIYRAILTNTPLFIYRKHTLFSNTSSQEGHFYKKIYIEDINMSSLIEQIEKTHSYIFVYGDVHNIGKIGLISTTNYSIIEVYRKSYNTLYFEVKSNTTYKIIVILGLDNNITSTNCMFARLRSHNYQAYITPLLRGDRLVEIKFSKPIDYLLNTGNTIDITFEDKGRPTIESIIVTIIANLVIILVILLITYLILRFTKTI